MMVQTRYIEDYNKIIKILTNPNNKEKHLMALKNIVNNFKNNYGKSLLSQRLDSLYFNIRINILTDNNF
jgi:hypothetical protein